MATEQRQAVRLAVSPDCRSSLLKTRQGTVAAQIVDESAGGFGVFVEGEQQFAVGDVLLLQRRCDWFKVGVMHVWSLNNGARIGLKRLGDAQLQPEVDNDTRKLFWLGRFGLDGWTCSLILCTTIGLVVVLTMPTSRQYFQRHALVASNQPRVALARATATPPPKTTALNRSDSNRRLPARAVAARGPATKPTAKRPTQAPEELAPDDDRRAGNLRVIRDLADSLIGDLGQLAVSAEQKRLFREVVNSVAKRLQSPRDLRDRDNEVTPRAVLAQFDEPHRNAVKAVYEALNEQQKQQWDALTSGLAEEAPQVAFLLLPQVAQRLDLTTAQRRQIAAIIRSTTSKLDGGRQQVAARDELVERALAQTDSVLTAGQRELCRSLLHDVPHTG